MDRLETRELESSPGVNNPYRHLKPVHWLIAVAGGLVLAALREWFEPGYFLFANTLILVLAMILAFTILVQKRAWAYGLAAFVLGVGWHALEAWLVIRSGECPAPSETWLSFVTQLDQCLDYREDWVLGAQPLVIAGAVVLLFIFIRDISSAVAWWRRERLFDRLRRRG
ncbi:MAG: hypothetical protein WD397_15065 [Wenzhouxiangellaceae bacterium]